MREKAGYESVWIDEIHMHGYTHIQSISIWKDMHQTIIP